MAQYARPTSDVVAGGWTDEGTVDNDGNLYTSVDEVTQDGGDSYILADGVNTTCELGLSSVTDPGGNTGYVLRVWMRAAGGGGPERLVLHLYEGATLRATSGNFTNRSGSYAERTYELLTTEADAITAFDDLRIKVESANLAGGDDMFVTQVEFEVPEAAVGDLDASTSDGVSVGENILRSMLITLTVLTGAIGVGEAREVYLQELVPNVSETTIVVADVPTMSLEAPDTYEISVADAVSVGEARELETDNPAIDLAESITVGEDRTVAFDTGDLDATTSDSINITEVSPGVEVPDPEISVSDSIAVADTPTVWGYSINVSDEILVGEDPHVGWLATWEDLAVGEYVELFVESPTGDLSVSVLDSLAIGEDVDVSDQTNPDVLDAITLGESVDLDVISAGTISVSDAISLTESVGISHQTNPEVLDSINVGESVSLETEEPAVDLADAVTVGESIGVYLQELVVSASESLSVVDSPTVSVEAVPDRTIDVLDAVSLGEDRDVSIPAIGVFEVNVSDAVSLGEDVDISDQTNPDVLDSISLGENVNLAVVSAGEVTVSDAVSVGESVGISHQTNPEVLDAITLGESIALATDDPEVSVLNAIAVADAPNAEVEAVPARTITTSEAISLGEAVAAIIKEQVPQAADSIAVGDAPVVFLPELTPQVADNVALGDVPQVSIEAVAAREVATSDTVTLGETPDAVLVSLISVAEAVTLGDAPALTTDDPGISVADAITVTATPTVEREGELPPEFFGIDLRAYLEYNYAITAQTEDDQGMTAHTEDDQEIKGYVNEQ